MKKIFLTENICGDREFVTVDYGNKIVRWYAGEDVIGAENCDCVEDDSSWGDGPFSGVETNLTDRQIKDYVSELMILDERVFI